MPYNYAAHTIRDVQLYELSCPARVPVLGYSFYLTHAGAAGPCASRIRRGWASLLGSLSFLYSQLQIYAAQFESLVGRWEEERFDLLQPDTPGPHHILSFLCLEQIKDVGTKELELLGVSSGSRTAGGGHDYIKNMG